jgi:hypothetical protein
LAIRVIQPGKGSRHSKEWIEGLNARRQAVRVMRSATGIMRWIRAEHRRLDKCRWD